MTSKGFPMSRTTRLLLAWNLALTIALVCLGAARDQAPTDLTVKHLYAEAISVRSLQPGAATIDILANKSASGVWVMQGDRMSSIQMDNGRATLQLQGMPYSDPRYKANQAADFAISVDQGGTTSIQSRSIDGILHTLDPTTLRITKKLPAKKS